MKEGGGDHEPVPITETHGNKSVDRRGEPILMSGDHPFRLSGGTGSIGQTEGILRQYFHPGFRRRIFPENDGIIRMKFLPKAHLYQMLQGIYRFQAFHLVRKFTVVEKNFRLAILCNFFQFRRLQPIVQRNSNRPDLGRRHENRGKRVVRQTQ